MIRKESLDAKVAELLDVLYVRRFAQLQALTLTNLLNKNPYLFRAIGIQRPDHFLDGLLSARISSSDETISATSFLSRLRCGRQRTHTFRTERCPSVPVQAKISRSSQPLSISPFR